MDTYLDVLEDLVNAPPPTSPPAAPAAVLAPTPEEIDGAIGDYEYAQNHLQAVQEERDRQKARLVFLVETFGAAPPHAEQSKRLIGRHHEATITFSTSYAVVEEGVNDLRIYLSNHSLLDLFHRFFTPYTKYKMVDGARDVLRTLSLPKRTSERIAALVGLAIDVKTSAPSLKVKTVQPEKPARTTRKGKAAA